MGYWSTPQTIAIVAVSYTSSILSFFGALFIIFVYVKFARLRTFTRKLVFYLAIADLVGSISWITSRIAGNYETCRYIGGVAVYVYLADFLWMACIAFDVRYQLVYGRPSRHLEKFYHLICWLVPVPLAVTPIVRRSMGKSYISCWFVDEADPFNIVFLSVMVCCLTFCVVVYFWAIKLYRERLKRTGVYADAQREEVAEVRRRAIAYLLVFLICWGLNPITDLLEIFDKPIYALYLYISAAAPLQGFVNCLIYGWNKKVIIGICYRKQEGEFLLDDEGPSSRH